MVFTRNGPYRLLPAVLIAVLLNAPALWSQANESTEDPAALVGLTLEELIARFGVPESVYAVRGPESWQDDVVFVYGNQDFYVYKDRIWQLGLNSVYGIKLGDSRAVAALIFEDLQLFDTYGVLSLPGRSWPLSLRLEWGSTAIISAIYLYRSDF
ncbi:hypothetical protein FACS1894141_5150 [Spirochaetia bacterium]|nr:hypothetical protein FACS1894141_5150 [Spirochaetia bacterium]